MRERRLTVAVLAILTAAFLVSCADKDSARSTEHPYAKKIAEIIAEGKHLLSIGQTVAAEEKFKEVFEYDANNGEARFGAVFSNTLSLIDFFTSLVSLALQLKTANGMLPASEPDRAEHLFGMIEDVLSDLHERMDYLRTETLLLLETDPDFTFDIDNLVLFVFLKPAASLAGIYTKREATLMLSLFESVEASLSFLRSQNLKIAAFDIINEVENMVDMWGNSTVRTFKDVSVLLAKILSDNPDFLALKEEEGAFLYTGAGELLKSSFGHILECINLFRSAGVVENANEYFLFMTTESSTGEEGIVFDHMISGVKGESALTDILVEDSTQEEEDESELEEPYIYESVTVPLTANLVDGITSFADSLGSGNERVNLRNDIIPLLAVIVFVAAQIIDFEQLIGADMSANLVSALVSPDLIEVLLITFVPDIFEFDLFAFYSNPIGLRSFFPALRSRIPGWRGIWEENGLLLEWECPEEEIDEDGFPGGRYGAFCTDTTEPQDWSDTGHFIGTPFEMEADGVYFATPMIAFGDPTFNGLLYIDLNPLEIEGYDDPIGFEAATAEDLNAIIGYIFDLIAGLFN